MNRRAYVQWLVAEVLSLYLVLLSFSFLFFFFLSSLQVGVKEAAELRWIDFANHHGRGLLKRFAESPHLIIASLSDSFDDDTLRKNRSDTMSSKGKGEENKMDEKRKGKSTPRNYWVLSPPPSSFPLPPFSHVSCYPPLFLLRLSRCFSSSRAASPPLFLQDSLENQRRYLEELRRTLGHSQTTTDLSEWYSVGYSDFAAHNGLGLLVHKYGGSLYHLLRTVFPEYDFLPWRFKKVPKDLFDDQLTISKLKALLEKDLRIVTFEDWYRVTQSQLAEIGLANVFGGKGMMNFLEKAYPEVKWKEEALLSKRNGKSPEKKASL